MINTIAYMYSVVVSTHPSMKELFESACMYHERAVMMVESRRTVNPLHWKRCRFDSCFSHLYEVVSKYQLISRVNLI